MTDSATGATGLDRINLRLAADTFAAIDRAQAAHLPAVQWKLVNLNKLKRENPAKHAAQRDALLARWRQPASAREPQAA